MKKVIIIYLLICLLSFTGVKSSDLASSFYSNEYIHFHFAYDIHNLYEVVDFSDNVIIGKATKIHDTVLDDDSTYEYPSTVLEFNIVSVLKGEITEDNISLEMLGGKIDNTFYQSEGTEFSELNYPELNDLFILMFNDYNDVVSIYASSQMILIQDVNFEESVYYQIVVDYVNYGITYNHVNVFEDGDGGSDTPGDAGISGDGTSFAEAIVINEGASQSISLDGFQTEYYKFNSDYYREMELSFYNGNLDLHVTLYDSSYFPINHEYVYSDGSFESLIYNDIIFVEVENTEALTGSVSMKYNNKYSNEKCINNPNHLTNLLDSIVSNEITWFSTSTYSSEVSYAIGEWYELGLVDFTQTLSGRVEIEDYYSDSDGYLALWNPLNNNIYLNDYYFSSMTIEARYKTIMHEVGHALGLGHMRASYNNRIEVSEDSSNVMYTLQQSLTELGDCDRFVNRFRNE